MKSLSRSLPALCRRAVVSTFVASVFSSTAIVAQPLPPLQIDPVIVTATRIAQPVSSLLSDVRVIDANDIANAGNQTLVELLQTHGGIEIASNGGAGQPAAVFVRGTNANHVVVLIDGIRIHSATTGTNALEHIPLASIERIEIVRGAASSLYGADAIGGVIQIFTRRDRTTVSAGAGSWNSRRASGSLFREIGSLKVGIRAGYDETDSFSATNERNAFAFNPDRDPYRNRRAAITGEYAIASGHSVSLSGTVSEGVARFDSGPSVAGVADDVNRQRLSTLALESRDRISAAWTSTLKIARATDDLTVEGSFPGRFRTDQDQLSWQNDITMPFGAIAAGYEIRREKVDSDTAYNQTTRTIRSAFGSLSGRYGAHLIQASIRHDDNSQFGGRTTGNAGYEYRLLPSWRAVMSAGTAFKAPSFNDLYFASPFFSGNASLQPERSRSIEAGVHYDGNPATASIVLFNNRVRDLIAVDPTFTTVINVDEARIRGGTLRASTDLLGLRVKGEFTHADAVDASTGRMLPRRARNYGSASVAAQSGPWRYGAEVIASGRRYDSVSNAASSLLAGYALVNLRAGYAITPAWSVNVRWNNVFDRDYELVRGYNTPGSMVFASIDYAAP